MKRFLLSAALLLACSGVALAQESEFSGGGGGGITTAPGSGTAGRVPQFASTTSLEDSKMTTSGTNSGTWTLYDPTLVNGETKLVLRAGVAQSTSAPIFEVLDAAGDSLSGGDGVMQFVSGQAGVGARFYEVTSSAQDWSLGPNIFSMKSTYELRWSDGAFFYGSIDTGIARSAAGILAVTDGSTGQGGIGLSDAATATVSDALVLRHATSGTAAASFGTGLLFQGEDAGGNMQDMARISAVYETATDGAERAHLRFHNRYDGATYSTAEIRLIDPDSLAGSLRFLNSAGGGLVSEAGPMSFLSDTYIRFGERGVAYRWEIPETTGHWVPAATNTYDIGTSSAFVRNNYVSTSIQGVRAEVIPSDNVAENFVQISSATENAVTAGYIEYTVTAVDTTNEIIQTETGVVPFVAVNENTTVTSTLGTPYGVHQDNAGGAALAVSFAAVVTGTNVMMTVTSNYDQATLTGTVVNTLRYRVVLTSGTATVTPQT